ncbi:ABC transporter ATP-binding protein [Sulfobacillus harzensis]|uniref:ABC transporter ATP-binding protein n=1 Tax=Sulfobacillus harzensis TaxID=2729629 RepID=A0A7Y0L699_9FIRM|nr:ABC transporter ATP-binding protein [Sulfobacillus harzensis]NMP23516.1 ABC transporter ATP-binding protein [Sulfobacillus harzensis]
MSPTQLIRAFILERKWGYLAAVLAIGMAQFFQVRIPHILGKFINRLKLGGSTEHIILGFALELAVVAAGYVIFFGFGQTQVGRLGRTWEYEMRQHLFSHWETLSSRYFQQHSVGDLLNHSLNDVTAVRQALSMGLNQISQAVFLFIATLYMTIRTIDLKLTLFSLVPLLLIPVVIAIIRPQVRLRSRLVQEGLSDMSELAEESFQAIRLIKAASNEPIEVARFADKTQTIVDRQMNLVRLNTLFQALVPLLSGIGFTVGLVYGGWLVIHGQISLGSFVAFTVYLSMLVQPLMQFGIVINLFQNASASIVRLQVLLAEEPDIRDPAEPVVRDVWRGALKIQRLTFQYPNSEHPTLQNVSVDVPEGRTLGIVGRTGAGKTTLLNLILRDYDPPAGTVFFDGVDIRDMRLQDLRELIAYVPQDGFLFSTTIGHNIAFSRPQVVPEDVEEAARQSRIWETIEGMPDGIDTEIGERGIMLSGGQRQRTAIARALIKSEAKILMLDDSLSAVDTRTESEILRVLRQVRGKKTCIIAAHRLSALRDADWIIVLDKGRIVQSGIHEDLVRQPGLYRELYQIQTGGEPAHA